LFSNLNIETQREAAKLPNQTTGAAAPVENDPNAVKPEVVVFTVKANFGSKPQSQQQTPAPANQVAKK
jgi:hypothetical protein